MVTTNNLNFRLKLWNWKLWQIILLYGFSTVLHRFRRIYVVQYSLRENYATNIIPSYRFYLFPNWSRGKVNVLILSHTCQTPKKRQGFWSASLGSSFWWLALLICLEFLRYLDFMDYLDKMIFIKIIPNKIIVNLSQGFWLHREYIVLLKKKIMVNTLVFHLIWHELTW